MVSQVHVARLAAFIASQHHAVAVAGFGICWKLKRSAYESFVRTSQATWKVAAHWQSPVMARPWGSSKELDANILIRPVLGVRVEARKRLGSRDPDDWPILASAFVLGCPIRTEDTDFFGCGVATWTSNNGGEIFLGN